MPQTNELAVFQGKQIRRVWHNNQWHFVILDIIRVLTDSPNPSDYLKKIRKRDESLNEGWGQIVTPLEIETTKATFGLTPSQYQKFKGLTTQNLRDHMDDIELILTMLGEATTTRFTRIRLYSIKFLLIKLSKSLNNSNLSVKLFKNKTRWYSPI